MSARVSPQVNLTLRAVSQQSLPHGGTLLGLASWDDPAGRFGLESVASSDGGVLGLRGLWNVTNPSSVTDPTTLAPVLNSAADTSSDKERINGRLSAGGEFYYGLLNKSGGFSVGTRFQTLPTHHGTPLTATLTFNLLGHMSLTYSVLAGDCTLATEYDLLLLCFINVFFFFLLVACVPVSFTLSFWTITDLWHVHRFGFNAYSYESDWAVGMELWNNRKSRTSVTPAEETPGDASAVVEELDAASAKPEQPTKTRSDIGTPSVIPASTRTKERSFQAKLEWRLDDDEIVTENDHGSSESMGGNETPQGPAGVLKWRCDQRMRMGLLYEGRYKSLLFSLGTDINLKKLDAPFRTVGLAVQFSS